VKTIDKLLKVVLILILDQRFERNHLLTFHVPDVEYTV